MPLNPEVNTPQGSRATGASVRKLIMVHELVHAAGLNGKNDHSTNDLFNGYPTVRYGATPDKDTVYNTFAGKIVHMPPLFLSSDTVKLLKPLW